MVVHDILRNRRNTGIGDSPYFGMSRGETHPPTEFGWGFFASNNLFFKPHETEAN